jgi:fumarylacetoacetate (FAA) hydrolase family protein
MLDDLPSDWRAATLVGRLITSDGPTPVLLRHGRIEDMSGVAPTMAELLALDDPAAQAGRDLGPVEELSARPAYEDGEAPSQLLSPIDLQCVKASGVTFAVSALERVIEERARGEAARARDIRAALEQRVGGDLRSAKPGSPEAAKLKEALIADGLWSQYLEVAIGPNAEIFTKSQILSTVGWGAHVGVRSDSHWNNPEPEVVLACDGRGRIRGATLGNDVNLRDFEGRSALLLGEAKDNNASCALGPFVRLFDDGFTLDDVRQAVVTLEVTGEDGFRLHGESSMREISRDPEELVHQALEHHQYPDGFVLFLGTLFAPTQDRDTPGGGFTHKEGDLVVVASERLGALRNKVTSCQAAAPWRFGVSGLMRNLAGRGLLTERAAA